MLFVRSCTLDSQLAPYYPWYRGTWARNTQSRNGGRKCLYHVGRLMLRLSSMPRLTWQFSPHAVILSGMMSAPETPTNVLISGFLSAWLSQRYVMKKYPKWYEKYSKQRDIPLSSVLDISFWRLLLPLVRLCSVCCIRQWHVHSGTHRLPVWPGWVLGVVGEF